MYKSSSFFGTYGIVYSLSDKNGNVFYVGCTIQPLQKRVTAHINEAANCENIDKKSCIIRANDGKVSAAVLERKWVTGINGKAAQLRLLNIENYWVKKVESLGYVLCNKVGITKDHDIINPMLNNKEVIGALADAFEKSIFTIQRWIESESDLLTSDKAKEVFARKGVEWPLKKSA